jgi:hypothetical protein
MKIECTILAVAAATLAGCTVKNTTVEESTAPSAGGKVLTYEVRNMTDFDAAKSKAESTRPLAVWRGRALPRPLAGTQR